MRDIRRKAGSLFVTVWRCHVRPAFSKDWDILAVIVMLSLALRIYFAVVFDGNLKLGFGREYFARAVSGAIDTCHAPLYPLLLRLISNLPGVDVPTSVFILQGIVSSAGLLLVYYMATRLCGRCAGLIAASIGAVLPALILYNLSTTPVSLGLFMVLVITASGMSRLGRRASSILTSAALAFGILLDPVMIALLPGMLITARNRLAFILVLAGLLLPWSLRNSLREGRPVPVYCAEAYMIDLGMYVPNDIEGRWYTVRRIYENATRITGRRWGATGDSEEDEDRNSTYAAGYAYMIVMLAGFIGIARRVRKSHVRAVIPLVTAIALLMLCTSFPYRFRIFVIPLFLVYAGALAGGCRTGDSPSAIEDCADSWRLE